MGSKTIHGPTDQKTVSQHPTNSGRWLVLMIPIDSEGLSMWDHLHWLPYLIIFPSICGSLKTESERARVTSFMTDWYWNPRWVRTWFVPPPWWLEPDELWASFLVRTPSLISSSSISKHGHMHGAHVLITFGRYPHWIGDDQNQTCECKHRVRSQFNWLKKERFREGKQK